MLTYIKGALVATIRYWFVERLDPAWGLKAHIARELIRIMSKKMIPVTSEDDIDSINFDDIQAHFASRSMPTSSFPIDKGVIGQIDIPVNQVTIDPQYSAGTSVGDRMLCDLITAEKLASDRVINSEIVSSWSVADDHGIDKESANDILTQIEPLSATESIILHIPGGGFVVGKPESHRQMVGQMSLDTRLRCMVFEYRKAPKYPFPAQLHDSLVVFLYLVKKGFKPENIILSGDSAGGHILLTLLFVLRKACMHRVRGAIVISPVVDFVFLPNDTIEKNKHYDFLSMYPLDMPTSTQRLFFKPGTRCTPEYIEELKDPLVSPIYGDFSDFPCTLIQAGGKEMLLGHSRILYKNINAANPDGTILFEDIKDAVHVPHFYTIFPGAEEGFAGIKRFVKSL